MLAYTKIWILDEKKQQKHIKIRNVALASNWNK